VLAGEFDHRFAFSLAFQTNCIHLLYIINKTNTHIDDNSDHSSKTSSKTSPKTSSKTSSKASLERVAWESSSLRLERSCDGSSIFIKAHEIVGRIRLVSVDFERVIERVNWVVSGTWRDHEWIGILRLLGVRLSKKTTIGSHVLFLAKRVLHVSLIYQVLWWIARLNLWTLDHCSSLVTLTLIFLI
jgi:hypothetical protein